MKNRNKYFGINVFLFIASLFCASAWSLWSKDKMPDIQNAHFVKVVYFNSSDRQTNNILVDKFQTNFVDIKHKNAFDYFNAAEMYALLGEYDQAYDYLNLAIKDHTGLAKPIEIMLFKRALLAHKTFAVSRQNRKTIVQNCINELMDLNTNSAKELAIELMMLIGQNEKAAELLKSILDETVDQGKVIKFKLLLSQLT